MKSLEILEHIKNAPEFMGGDERYKSSINSPIRYIEDIMAIKQGLEVLEIIWKKKVDLDHLKYCIEEPFKGDYDPIELILFTYNFCMKAEKKLTLEELQKIKQWLEENDE